MFTVQRNLLPLLVVLLMSFALACGDDDVDDGEAGAPANAGDCPAGQAWHPIAESCVDDDGASGNTGGNDGTNDGTNNGLDEGSNDGTNDGSNSGANDGTNDGTNSGANNGGNDGANNGGNGEANNTTPAPGECGPGSIVGQTCRPDGQVLPGAEITLIGDDCDGQEFTMETVADQDGFYEFEDVDAGTHTVRIEAGSFFAEEPILVRKDEQTNWVSSDAKLCLEGSGVPIAVIEGAYDDIGGILGGMDIEYDVVGSDMGSGMSFLLGDNEAADFLSDINEMNQYNILFIECGSLWSDLSGGGFDNFFGGGSDVDTDEILDNLRQFVESGNSLYVSDQAQPFIQKGLPDAVQFYNDSGGAAGPRVGDAQDIQADVVSNEMQAVIGPGPTLINFNLAGVAIAEDGGPTSTVHFRGDVESTQAGLIHDAALMLTYDDPVGGRAIFTSFHNSAQPAGDMEDILESMIFQL